MGEKPPIFQKSCGDLGKISGWKMLDIDFFSENTRKFKEDFVRSARLEDTEFVRIYWDLTPWSDVNVAANQSNEWCTNKFGQL